MNYDIDQYIDNYFQGVATPQEIAILNEWIEKDEKNLHYFFRKRSLYESTHLVFSPQKIRTDRAWQKIEPFIVPQKRYRLLKLTAVAAAAVVLILCSTLLFQKQIRTEDGPIQQPILAVSTTPSPILILPSGEEIALNDTQTLQNKISGVTISANNIQYDTNITSQQELIYHALQVPRGAEYFLTLNDGSKVWINADSKVRYPVTFASEERKIFVEGEVYLEVAHKPHAPFRVITPQGEITVLGTQFNINAYPEEKCSFITLAQGKIEIKSIFHNQIVTLAPGEQAVLYHTNGKLYKKRVDPTLFCSWSKGIIHFKNNSLEEIMRRLARWYNLQIIWQDESLKKITFSGELKRYEEIDQLLQMISHTNDVKFTNNNKEIYVQKP